MPIQPTIVGGLPLGSTSSRTRGSWPDLQYQVCFSSSYETNLKSNHKDVDYSYEVHASIVPMLADLVRVPML